jgi:RHS repeat-associated protein
MPNQNNYGYILPYLAHFVLENRSNILYINANYHPFGMVMVNRSGGDYRYGFQNQEVDDEIKGNGNSVNYKYRMHDPRVGRFFAVDPLAPNYPHNGPYNFSENRVIDGVDLEGLEWYYAADGSFIGRYGETPEIRVINAKDAIDGKKYVDWAMGCDKVGRKQAAEHNNEQAIKFSTDLIQFYGGKNGQNVIQDRIEATGKILDHQYSSMFTDISKLKGGQILIGNSRTGDLIRGNEDLFSEDELSRLSVGTIEGRATTGNTNAILYSIPNNVANHHDLKALFSHERKHIYGGEFYGAGAWGEFNVHHWETTQGFYNSTSENYKSYTLEQLSSTLKDQQGYVLKHPNDKSARAVYENNVNKYQNVHSNQKGETDTFNDWSID